MAAEGINNAGRIVGSTNADMLHPFGINNSGQVIGSFADNNSTTQSVLSIGNANSKLSYPGAADTYARASTTKGSVGYWLGSDNTFPGLTIAHGFVYQDGTWSYLDASAGANGTFAEGINNSDLQ